MSEFKRAPEVARLITKLSTQHLPEDIPAMDYVVGLGMVIDVMLSQFKDQEGARSFVCEVLSQSKDYNEFENKDYNDHENN